MTSAAFSSDRIKDAPQWVIDLHARQSRKGTNTPCIAHLLSVGSLVLEDGGNEDEFVAGLDNARAILRDYRTFGDALWQRFNAGRDDQLWYYGGLTNAFGDGSTFAKELRLIVKELESAIATHPHRAETRSSLAPPSRGDR